MRPSVLVPVLFTLSACQPEDPCAVAATVDAPELVLGTGAEAFERPIEDGDTLRPSYGAQGGQHLYLAVRTSGFHPGDATLLGEDDAVPMFVVELADAATGDILTVQRFDYAPMEGDAVEAELALGEFFLPFYGGTSTYDVSTPSGEPPGERELILRATAEDACGTVLTAERTFLLDR